MKRLNSILCFLCVPLVAALFVFGCRSLEGGLISVELAGPVILDALEWGEESVKRDVALLEFEREQALESIQMARDIIEKAR